MNAFEWSSPATIEQAVKLLAPPVSAADTADPDEAPRPIAGGQDLLTTMKDYISRPTRVVNLKTIAGMDHLIADASKGLRLGALVTLSQLEDHPVIQKSFPGLAQAAHAVATPQIRNLATIAGNLCQRPRCWYFRLEHVQCLKKGGSECYAKNGENKYHAIFGGGPSYIVHPSDIAPMLVALNASVTIAGPSGKRDLPLEQFFTLPGNSNIRRENVLLPDEIITEISVPASPLAAQSTYLKFKERESLDFAMAAVAAAVDFAPDKSVRQARIVLGGVAPIPWRVPKAEASLVGKPLTLETATVAAKLALGGAAPLQHNAYKIPLTQTLVRRALLNLAGA